VVANNGPPSATQENTLQATEERPVVIVHAGAPPVPAEDGGQPGSQPHTPKPNDKQPHQPCLRPDPPISSNADGHGDTMGPLPNERSLARRSAPGTTAATALQSSSVGAPPPLGRPLPRLARASAPPNLARTSTCHAAIQSVRQVEQVPRQAVRAAMVVSINALVMAAAEILIEILMVSGVYPKLPFRLDFFFLTLLSALLGYHTLVSVRQGHFDTSRNALQVGGLVELALIVGDVVFIAESAEKNPASVPTRVPFLVLTALNLGLVIFLYVEMYRFHKREEAQAEETALAVEVVTLPQV